MRAIVFANGRLSDPLLDRGRLRPDDRIIAADGGARHCRELGLIPGAIIGDFDSLTPEELAAFQASGSSLVPHPRRKDETDLELALGYARDQGADEILVLGGMGARWDQTLANVLLLAELDLPAGRALLADGNQEVCLLRGGERLRLAGSLGDTVSLIPVAGDAQGVATQGLEYPLAGEPLRFGATRGVSNAIRSLPAAVSLLAGALLVVLIRRAPGEGALDGG